MPDEEEHLDRNNDRKRARAEYAHLAYLIEWDNMVTGGEPPFDPAGAEREFAKKAYESEDWSLGNVLSWRAFRDPALICRFEPRWVGGDWSKARWREDQWREARHLTSRQRLMLYRLRPMLNRPMLVERPDQELLAALQANRLTAIRDGQELPSVYWFGKDVEHLTDDLRFRRAEAIKCWHTEKRQPDAVLDEAVIISPSTGIAEAKADQQQVGGRERPAPAARRRRGPMPGSRFKVPDWELCPVIEELMKADKSSQTAVTLKLARGEIPDKTVSGSGTPESRAKRLSKVYTVYLEEQRLKTTKAEIR
jgi:hypothetical protein